MLCRKQHPPEDQRHSGSAEAESTGGDFSLEQNRIHLSNGTLLIGIFTERRPEIVRNLLPVAYCPDAQSRSCGCGFWRSCRIRTNREAVKRDNNTIFAFMESEGDIRLKADAAISSKDFYTIYRMWCEENSFVPLKARGFNGAMVSSAAKYNLDHCNNVTNPAGWRVGTSWAQTRLRDLRNL